MKRSMDSPVKFRTSSSSSSSGSPKFPVFPSMKKKKTANLASGSTSKGLPSKINGLASAVRTAVPAISSPESPDLFETSSSSSHSEKGTSPTSSSMCLDLFPS